MITVPFFIAHQGCPHQCIFCNQVKIAGAGESIPDADEILAKVAAFSRSAGGRALQVAFFGGTFTALSRPLQRQLLLPLQPLLEQGTITAIRISTRPDYIALDDTMFLRSMGVTVVELGIQSMADDVLARAARGYGAADVERAASVVHEAGLKMGAQLMVGLPGDTPDKAMASLERVISLHPHCLRIYPTLVIDGTTLAAWYRNGSYAPLTMEEAVRQSARMLHRAWSADLPVIRMGLQATDELQAAGTVVAGPYHPAFRYLVEAKLCQQLLTLLMRKVKPGSAVAVSCAPGRISTVIGHKRLNIEQLERLYGVRVDRVFGNPAFSPFELAVEADGKLLGGHLVHDLELGPAALF